ncbi:MAG: PhnD/SsuA/transferrin family substrate-binding protein [Rhodocyclaceae bacterium]|nr:PhnD/SsuA/transferrin family substrate-binding protein [Rhodocyclaceae bacterium]MDZ4216123.1 PhnD/SsuA/transferrin family substrate-binding protein [Rhodocyclaceae bacterium]
MDVRSFSFARLCALLLACWPTLVCAGELRIGVLAWFGDQTAATQWQRLGAALQARLPDTMVQMAYHDMDGLEKALAAGELDFIITNPGHYVVLESRHRATRIATQKIEPDRDSEHAVGSAVIVPSERSDLQTLDDLRGKRIAATVPDGFSGWLTVWAELKRRDIDPEREEVTPVFAGLPMSRVLDKLESGEVDAGILRVCLLEHLVRQGRLPAGRYRVLSPQEPDAPCLRSTPTYPGWAFAAAVQTPDALARATLVALLLLDGRGDVLRWGVPADYHPVHAMLRDLQVDPYDFLREHRLEAQIRRYWPIGAGLLVLLLLWLFYTLRVEVLVQRRTRELSAALAARDEIEERMQTQREKMEHLSRLSVLGELSGTLAHELNQPLATIGNYARSLTRRMWTGKLSDDAVAQAAHEIAEQAERAAGILEGIRNFARKRASERKDCDAVKLVDEIVTLFRGMLPRAPEIHIEDRLPDEHRRVCVDRLQIQQVLLNLMKNAFDAHCAIGRAGEPIEILLAPAGERTKITVRDHGPGLADADGARLFEPFFTTKPDGMGLGLSICKGIVEAHAGQLAAAPPDDGHGLCLSFTLPCAATPHHDAT